MALVREVVARVALVIDLVRLLGLQVRELGVALGPAIGWVDEGLEALRDRNIVSLQTVFNVLEQEPGLTFAAEPARS